MIYFSDIDDEDENESGNENYEDEDEEENPLDMDILDASTKSAKAKTVADVWFEQDIFKQALEDDDNDEEFELERKLTALKSDGVTVLGKPSKGILKTTQSKNILFYIFNLIEMFLVDDSSESEDDTKSKRSKRGLNDDEFEEVPIDHRMHFFIIHMTFYNRFFLFF